MESVQDLDPLVYDWYMIYAHVVLLYLLLKTLQAYLFLA